MVYQSTRFSEAWKDHIDELNEKGFEEAIRTAKLRRQVAEESRRNRARGVRGTVTEAAESEG